MLYYLGVLLLMIILYGYFKGVITDWWRTRANKHKERKIRQSSLCDFESSIFSKFEEEVISRIDKVETYRKFGLRTSRGLILHGPPGTGKTSAVLALKEKLGKRVRMYRFARRELNELGWRLAEARKNAPAIIVFEDADAYLADRKQFSESGLLGTLLEELDGSQDNSGLFFILTTNHYDKLDAAIMRAGRFDTHIEMKPIEDCNTAVGVVKAQFPHLNIDFDFFKDNINLPDTPANIVGIIEKAAQVAIDKGINAESDKLDISNEILSYVFKDPPKKEFIGFGK